MTTSIKCVVVGDGSVGKTCMLTRFCDDTFPEDYVPTIFDNTSIDMNVEKKEVTLCLWDTAGQEDYDRLRPLSYPSTNVFLLCFAINNHISLDNIKSKWYPELNFHCPNTPIVLVGTKVDTRKSKDKEESNKKMVTKAEGEKIGKFIKAHKYFECSALTKESLPEVFEEAVRCVLQPKSKPSSGKCTVI